MEGNGMNEQKESFGEFLAAKRMEAKLTYRELAGGLSCSIPYLSDVEKGRRLPPDMEKLKKLARMLELSAQDENKLYDLAGKMRNTVAPDLPEYVRREYVSAALRKARDLGAGEKEWRQFLEELQNRKG